MIKIMLTDYIKPLQTFIACPNQDVAYGLGYFSLDVEPIVIQVPDFGDRFWVYAMCDARTDQFARLDKPCGTKPGDFDPAKQFRNNTGSCRRFYEDNHIQQ